MAKTAAAVLTSIALLIAITAAGATSLLSTFTGTAGMASSTALTDIPPDYLSLYIDAARTCPGLDWTVLAAIGKVESDHGRSGLPGVHSGANSAGARGPMQFLPATFTSLVTQLPDSQGEAAPSPYNPHDAIYAAAAYLCQSGARNNHNLHAAIYTYNHADWYVSEVLAQAATYRSPTTLGAGIAPTAAALEAINYAQRPTRPPLRMGRRRLLPR